MNKNNKYSQRHNGKEGKQKSPKRDVAQEISNLLKNRAGDSFHAIIKENTNLLLPFETDDKKLTTKALKNQFNELNRSQLFNYLEPLKVALREAQKEPFEAAKNKLLEIIRVMYSKDNHILHHQFKDLIAKEILYEKIIEGDDGDFIENLKAFLVFYEAIIASCEKK